MLIRLGLPVATFSEQEAQDHRKQKTCVISAEEANFIGRQAGKPFPFDVNKVTWCILRMSVLVPVCTGCMATNHMFPVQDTTEHHSSLHGCLAWLLHFHQRRWNPANVDDRSVQSSSTRNTLGSIPRDTRTFQESSSWRFGSSRDRRRMEPRGREVHSVRDQCCRWLGTQLRTFSRHFGIQL